MKPTADYPLSVQDVDNAVAEHMKALDELWPDHLPPGSAEIPDKKNMVELIDAIKLRLHRQAEKNLDRYESPFERSAKKITGITAREKAERDLQAKLASATPEPAGGKSAMQLAHEEAQRRMRGK